MKSRTAKKPAAPAPVVVNITQHIDARGVEASALPPLQDILLKAADQARRDIVERLERGGFSTLKPSDNAQTATRFWKVSSDGRALPHTAKDWEGVYDATTALIWGRRLLLGEHTWADAIKVAGAATLCGAPARAPTIQERRSIVDYSRVEPALDVSFFDPKETSGWEWTSTKAASPSDCAWYVNLGSGHSYRYHQSHHYRVRAVRAGQPLGI